MFSFLEKKCSEHIQIVIKKQNLHVTVPIIITLDFQVFVDLCHIIKNILMIIMIYVVDTYSFKL